MLERTLQRLGGLAASRTALRLLLGLEPDDPASVTWEPEERWTRLGEALEAVLRTWTQRHPLVLVVEDLHWADRSTLALLETVMPAVAGMPLVLLLTARLGETPPWASASFLTTVTLQRLSDAETLRMVQQLVGPAELTSALQRQLLQQTGGIPLFVEEVVKTWHDVGAVHQDAAGTRVIAETATPPLSVTLHALLAARLARLSPPARHVLQWAAVLGVTCARDLLTALVDDPTTLPAALHELQQREMLRGQGQAAEPTYTFTHALLQEVAYEALLTPQRQTLHRAVALALEVRAAARHGVPIATCAQHFFAGAVWDKALHYSRLAGEQAAESAANTEAQAYYAQALHAATQMQPPPDGLTLATLYRQAAGVHLVLAAYPAAEAAYHQALALARQLDDSPGVLDALLGLSTVYTNGRRGPEAQAVLAQARTAVQALADPAHRADYLARHVRLRTRGWGELREAMPDAEEAVRLAQGTAQPRLQAMTLTALGRVLTWRGMLPRSQGILTHGVTLAEQTHAGFARGMGLFFLGITQAALGTYEAAYQHYRALQTYAHQADDRYWIARVPNALAGLWLDLGHLEAAWAACQEAHAYGQRWDWTEVQGHALVQRGAVALAQGQPDEATRCFTQAQALLETDPWMRWRWELTLLQGWARLRLGQGKLAQAWTAATQARRLAQRTDSRKHLVRARLLQGTILAAQGQRPAALRVLASAIRRAQILQTPREVWQGLAALGQVHAQLGHEAEAAIARQQAIDTLTTLADGLQTPGWRQQFLTMSEIHTLSDPSATLT